MTIEESKDANRMTGKEVRTLKVHKTSGYQYRATPTIMLKGEWLKNAGFDIDDYICVSCENGMLVITPDTKRDEMEREEEAFMEHEIKKPHCLFLQTCHFEKVT